MNIGLDGHTLNDKEKFGVATYVYELTKDLINLGEKDSFTIYSNKPVREFLSAQNVNNKIIKSRFGWTKWRLSLEFILGKKPDVMLFPAHSMSIYAPMKSIITIHDLAFLFFPSYFTKKDLFRLKQITDDSIKRADHIITPSISTKKDIVNNYINIKDISEKISVIPMGFDKKIFYKRNSAEIKNIIKKYQLCRNYILYAGSFQPRKDIFTLIKAFELFVKNTPKTDLELVLVGGGGWMSESTKKAVKNSSQSSRIKFLGYLDRKELPAIFSGAKAFILPSLYEGFGMPILEAMACGTPVIYADNSSMPEVAGKAGIPFRTKDINDLCKKIKLITTNKETYQKKVKKSLEQARNYSWEITAQKTLNLIKKV